LVIFIGRFHRMFFIRQNCRPAIPAWSLKTWCGDCIPQVSLPMKEVLLFWSLKLNGILWALKLCKDYTQCSIDIKEILPFNIMYLLIYLLHSHCRYFYQLQWKNAM
jgi:hypothetical protein